MNIAQLRFPEAGEFRPESESQQKPAPKNQEYCSTLHFIHSWMGVISSYWPKLGGTLQSLVLSVSLLVHRRVPASWHCPSSGPCTVQDNTSVYGLSAVHVICPTSLVCSSGSSLCRLDQRFNLLNLRFTYLGPITSQPPSWFLGRGSNLPSLCFLSLGAPRKFTVAWEIDNADDQVNDLGKQSRINTSQKI